jgi:hypothetical protein
MDLLEIGLSVVDWIGLAQDYFTGMYMYEHVLLSSHTTLDSTVLVARMSANYITE